MDVAGEAVVPFSPDVVFAVVADLATYRHWLSIVLDAAPAPAVEGDSGPAWHVEIGARLGLVRTTKRLRMVRSACEAPVGVRFERQEDDGEPHPPWRLAGTLDETGAGTRLRMALHYGGGRTLPGLDLVLRREMGRAGSRLTRLLRHDAGRDHA